MSKIAILAKLTAQEGKREDLVAAIKLALPKADDEAGTLVYTCHTDETDQNAVWFYELYSDEDAMKAHMGGEVIKTMMPALGGLLGAPPEMHRITPFGGKGIPNS